MGISMSRYSHVEYSAFRANFLDLVRLAAKQNASDLHIEPYEGMVRIRVRVDGDLRILQEISGEVYASRFLLEAKKACRFDSGKIGVPQDQRLRLDEIPYDVRANLIPTLYGEKIVLRLLARGKEFSLESYAMPPAAKADLEAAIARWQGLILITGPTGSGKTTLLYSALSGIDRESFNIHTLEDPIEYELPGICQSAITVGELSFADALRALMRQDPDVIMIGEIRDAETAKAAMHAAATGHLVLSTIHANSAADSLRRLEDLGIDREQVASHLMFASAQRLVPRLCAHCTVDDYDGKKLLSKFFKLEFLPKRAMGCPQCAGSGVSGRVLLFEYLTTQAAQGVRRPIMQMSLRDHALSYLAEGVIDATTASAFAD